MELVIRIFLVLHVFLALVYGWDWYQEHGSLQETLIRLVICLCLPFFGFLFFKMVDYFYRKAPQAQMEELYLGKAREVEELSLLRPVNREEEMNKTSARDTLRMGEYGYRRKMIMDTLKEDDTADYLAVLKEALTNEDMETSHYASTVIMDIQKRLQERLVVLEKELEQDPEREESREQLEKELFEVIESGAFEENSLSRYYARYRQISDLLLAKPDAREAWYHNRIQVDLKTGDNIHGRETALRFLEHHPDSETAVVDMIRVCICLHDREGLDRFLESLKTMPVVLTTESLQYIRFLT